MISYTVSRSRPLNMIIASICYAWKEQNYYKNLWNARKFKYPLAVKYFSGFCFHSSTWTPPTSVLTNLYACFRDFHVLNADGNRKWAIFTFNLPSHNHIHIAKHFIPLEMSGIKIWETYGPSTRGVLFQFTCRPRFKNASAKLPNTRENPLCMNEEFLTISVLSRELLVNCSIAVVENILVWSLFSIS